MLKRRDAVGERTRDRHASARPHNTRSSSSRQRASSAAGFAHRFVVGDIVDEAAERIDRVERAAALGRQQHEGVVEIRRRAPRDSRAARVVGLERARRVAPRIDATALLSDSQAVHASALHPSLQVVEFAELRARGGKRRSRRARSRAGSRARRRRTSGCRGAAADRPSRCSARARAPAVRARRATSCRISATKFAASRCARADPPASRRSAAMSRARKIDAALVEIDRDVLPEIRELQVRCTPGRTDAGAPRRDSRTGTAPAGRPDWPSSASSRADRRCVSKPLKFTSERNARSRSANGSRGMSKRRTVSASATNTGWRGAPA